MNGTDALLGIHVLGQFVALLEPRKAPIAAPLPMASPSQSFTSSCSSEERAPACAATQSRHPATAPATARIKLSWFSADLQLPPLPLYNGHSFCAIFSATLPNHPLYQPMTSTAGSGSRVSIPRDERSFLHLSRKEQSLPLRRHERNLRLAHFFVPPLK